MTPPGLVTSFWGPNFVLYLFGRLRFASADARPPNLPRRTPLQAADGFDVRACYRLMTALLACQCGTGEVRKIVVSAVATFNVRLAGAQ